jgi:amino acid transporter
LPAWFTKLHPRFRTPTNSILSIGVVSLALGVVVTVGVGQQEAYQLFINASLILYALTYLVLFAVPLFGRIEPRPPPWLRIASASGFLMTLLFVVLSVFPIVEVESRFAFAAKITTVVVGTNVVGVGLFWVATRRRLHRAGPPR